MSATQAKVFQGKTALITGATSGIGRITALAFAEAGADVVLTGRRADLGEEVARLARAKGVRSVFVRADASKEEDIRRSIDEAKKLSGRLDIAFNNAGLEQVPGPLLETPVSTFDDVMNVNVRGLWLHLKHEVAAMAGSGGGVIINNASAAGLVGMAGVSVYIASKHAAIGLTKAVALEFAKANIRVNAVAPGPIQTPMFDRFAVDLPKGALESMVPQGRVGTPEEIASAVLWLAGPGATYVTGQVITIDGGFTAQ